MGISQGKWYNLFVTGTSLIDIQFYIFSHNGATQEVQTATLTGTGINDPTVGNNDNIVFNDNGDYCRIASIIYWNSRFSQTLCNDFFAIQKGRFGYDSNEDRIAEIGECV